MAQWCTIESDPAVFNELVQKYGAKGLQFEQVYSVEDMLTAGAERPIHGLIFLFKWHKQREKRECLEYYDEDLFFARQVIHNACATQAILSLLLNVPGIALGSQLKEFKEFTHDFDPESRGLAIGNCQFLRQNHNSFAQQNIYIQPSKSRKGKKEDVYHFITYIPHKGIVYELDGLQQGPIPLGPAHDDWVATAAQAVRQRIDSYSAKQIHFNLLALTDSKLDKIKQRIAEDQALQLSLLQASRPDDPIIKELKSRGIKPAADQGSSITIEQLQARLQDLKIQLTFESQRKQKQARQNIRRKHNYTPLIIASLRVLAKSGRLQELLQEAKRRLQPKQ